MNRVLLILFSVLLSLPVLGQKINGKKLDRYLNALEGFDDAYIGFLIEDMETNKTLYSRNADKYMTPGSVTKLFTTYAALNYLPKELIAAEYIVKGDSLIFWSTGYPLTLHPAHRDSTLIKFLDQTDKEIYYWPRPSEDQRFGPGWGWDDYLGYYGAEKSLFPLYGNSVQFIIDNENGIFDYSPKHQGIKVTLDTANSERSRVFRDEFWNEFKVQFGKEGIDTILRPFRYSHHLFTDLLGNSVQKDISLIEDFSLPKDYEILEGVKRDTLLKWMNQTSDNLFAEQTMAMVSSTRYDTLSVEKGKEFIMTISELSGNLDSPRKERVLNNNLVWRDGSGLTRYNMFKPSEIVELLKGLEKHGFGKILEFLPQGGVSGTLKDWYAPYVYAKTGTLSNNHALAGYLLTKKGRWFRFVLMVNHYTVSTSVIRTEIGKVLERLHEMY